MSLRGLLGSVAPHGETYGGTPGTVELASRADHRHGASTGWQIHSIPPATSTVAGLGLPLANDILLMPVYLPMSMRVVNIRWHVTTIDASANRYRLGVYNVTGELAVTTAQIAIASLGVQGNVPTVDPAGNYPVLNPGQHFLALTGNSTTAKWQGGGLLPSTGMFYGWGKLTGGGTTLPATITPTSITDVATNLPWLTLVGER